MFVLQPCMYIVYNMYDIISPYRLNRVVLYYLNRSESPWLIVIIILFISRESPHAQVQD